MRRIIESDFIGQTNLLGRLDTYRTGLGVGNYLDAMFTNEGIVWADIMAAIPLAKAKNTLKLSFAASSHEKTDQRNKKSKLPLKHMKGGGQNLKSLRPSDKLSITVWGFPVLASGKINYPSKFSDMYIIWQAYFAKDATYGVGLSPIKPYNTRNTIVMADDNTAMIAAKGFDDGAGTDDAASIENTNLRNDIWADPLTVITKVYNLIKTTNVDNERELGVAGFRVAGNPPGHKNQNSKALQESQVLIHGAIIGSIAYNNNAFDCWYIKGKDPLGAKIPFPKNSAIAVTKGMSQFIIGNDNALQIAKFVVTVRK